MDNIQFPAQQLPASRKTKAWRKSCVDFADNKLHVNYSKIRHSVLHQRINYDLMNGKLHMEDLELLCNPEGLKAKFIPDKIQHYPIINSKLNVLKGEEAKRTFDFRVIVTNPTAVSEIEEEKKQKIFQDIQQMIQDQSQSEEEFNQKLERLNQYYTYDYQDLRELYGNCILNHYNKEYNFSTLFNAGFNDAMIIGEEIYQCDIVGGEPVIERINPLNIRIFRSGSDNKIENADMIIIQDYWSPGRIYDTYYDVLTKKDIEYIENIQQDFGHGPVDSMDNIDERYGFVNANMVSDELADSTMFFDPLGEHTDAAINDLLPVDRNGNIRVIRVYWKSRRKIKKIKFYTEQGDEDFTFMPESYTPNEINGEEEASFWINEAWEGTKIGQEVYVNIRPRVVQYNTLSNPSRCHFGIIGSIYNINDDKPFSMVDMMKPYSYLYDIIHDRLNKMMARNWGKMTRMDLSKVPAGWNIDKWLYYAKTMGLFIEDSFREGVVGASLGKLSGAMNSNTQGVIDADFGNNIQQYINLLEYIKQEMSDVAGISKQREGQISNRETVGGVERATLQSSHITEWLFVTHEDLKKRVLEAFLETAKVAIRGRSKKFRYILPDGAVQTLNIDGDIFCECDYGLVVDNSNNIQDLNQKLESLAQAALQNQTLSFSTIMKLFMTASLAEKQRMVQNEENRVKEEQQQQQQQQMQLQQQAQEQQLQLTKDEQDFKDRINQRDNDTRVLTAEINSQAEMAILQIKNKLTEAEMEQKKDEDIEEPADDIEKQKLMESIRQFDEKLKLENRKALLEEQKLQLDKDKAQMNNNIKLKQLNKQ